VHSPMISGATRSLASLHSAFGDRSAQWLEENPARVQVGRAHAVQAPDGQGELCQDRRPYRADPAVPASRMPWGASYEAFKNWGRG